MTEKEKITDKEFSAVKMSLLEKYPEHKDAIELASTMRELYHATHPDVEIEDETKTETETPKDPKKMVVEHLHKIISERSENDDDDESKEQPLKLKKGVNTVLLEGWSQDEEGNLIPPNARGTSFEKRKFQNREEMLDELFKMEMAGKIEATRHKPNQKIVEMGNNATKLIEKLWSTAMENKSGRELVSRAGKDLLAGRVGPFHEPEWLRNLLNPEGRKRAKEKPFLRSN